MCCNLSLDHLLACATMILRLIQAAPITASKRHLTAVKKKFAQVKYLCVSNDRLPADPITRSTKTAAIGAD